MRNYVVRQIDICQTANVDQHTITHCTYHNIFCKYMCNMPPSCINSVSRCNIRQPCRARVMGIFAETVVCQWFYCNVRRRRVGGTALEKKENGIYFLFLLYYYSFALLFCFILILYRVNNKLKKSGG